MEGHMGCKKAKTFVPIISQRSYQLDGIWDTVETCWFDEHHSYHVSSDLYSRERTLLKGFCQKRLTLVTLLNIYRPISFTLVIRVNTTELYIFIPVLTLVFIQGYMRNQKLARLFSPKFLNRFEWNLVCFQSSLFIQAYAKITEHDKNSWERTQLIWFYDMYF